MKQTITITEDGLENSVGSGSVAKTTRADNLGDVLQKLGSTAYVNTGIIPVDGSGMVSLRSAMGFTQVVYQMTAGIHHVLWGMRERDPAATHMYVAQPYRQIIMDFKDEYFIGARHFYSHGAAYDIKQQLYHVNLPNTNCRGYNGTSVGWVCLYGHNFPKTNMTLGEKIMWVVRRMSGDEAYNDRNMSGTDGPRTYAMWMDKRYKSQTSKNKWKFLYDKAAWIKKTEEEGSEWVHEDIWMPIKVNGIDEQKAHVWTGGKNFTLEMAMYGNYQAYYQDPDRPRPFNSIDRKDLDPPANRVILPVISGAATKR